MPSSISAMILPSTGCVTARGLRRSSYFGALVLADGRLLGEELCEPPLHDVA
jgi:hypothetical protein